MSAGRILVVDDEPQIRRIMRTTLTGAGYEVDDAKTGEEALEKLRDYHPDLVLLDMNMPGMGGLAACREIRAGTGVGIIMLTVRNTESRQSAKRWTPAPTTSSTSPSARPSCWLASARRFDGCQPLRSPPPPASASASW